MDGDNGDTVSTLQYTDKGSKSSGRSYGLSKGGYGDLTGMVKGWLTSLGSGVNANSLAPFLVDSQGYFSTMQSLQDTGKGKYLDPTQVPVFQNYTRALWDEANQNLREQNAGTTARFAAATPGTVGSPLWQGLSDNQKAIAIATNKNLTEAATNLYNQERARQEEALVNYLSASKYPLDIYSALLPGFQSTESWKNIAEDSREWGIGSGEQSSDSGSKWTL